MHDLSLYLLELLENSVRAGATVVATRVAADRAADTLTISVEDDGHGLRVAPEQALDPFYTSKTGKRTGLGLSLLRQEAEAAGGRLDVGASELGGAAVTARMAYSNIDRPPLGDLASSFLVMVATNPHVEFRLEVHNGDESFSLRGDELTRKSDVLVAFQQALT